MKLIYLYHPNYKETKRVDIEREDGPADEARLTAQGWSRKRFAQSLYHPEEGARVCRTPEEAAELVKEGWTTQPITDAAKVEGAHPDAVHPHPHVHKPKVAAANLPKPVNPQSQFRK